MESYLRKLCSQAGSVGSCPGISGPPLLLRMSKEKVNIFLLCVLQRMEENELQFRNGHIHYQESFRKGLTFTLGSSFDSSTVTPHPILSDLMIHANFYRFVCNIKQFVKVLSSHNLPPHHHQKHKQHKN